MPTKFHKNIPPKFWDWLNHGISNALVLGFTRNSYTEDVLTQLILGIKVPHSKV